MKVASAMREKPGGAHNVVARIHLLYRALAVPFAVTVSVDWIGSIVFGVSAIQLPVKDFIGADVENGNAALRRDRRQIPRADAIDAQSLFRV